MAKKLFVQAVRDLVYQGRTIPRGDLFEMHVDREAIGLMRRREVTGAPRPRVWPVVAVALVVAPAPAVAPVEPPADARDLPDPDPGQCAPDESSDDDEPAVARVKRRYRRRDLQAAEA